MIRVTLSLTVAFLWAQTSLAQLAEPDPYRMDDYRAPVPATLAGATTLSIAAAAELWRSGRAAFVDVMPRPVKPAGLPEGTLWRDPTRRGIPGSVWLPNTGYGALSDEAAAYLQAGLDHASGGELNRPIVIYCLQDCWMSWNAAKRAVTLGYKAVNWFPQGTDGWQAAGLPLETLQPFKPVR